MMSQRSVDCQLSATSRNKCPSLGLPHLMALAAHHRATKLKENTMLRSLLAQRRVHGFGCCGELTIADDEADPTPVAGLLDSQSALVAETGREPDSTPQEAEPRDSIDEPARAVESADPSYRLHCRRII